MGWWHLLDAIYWHHADTVDMLLLGVLPEYRAKGANAVIFNDLIQQYIRYGFKWAQAMPQMETNHNVLSNWEYFDAHINKRLRCFIKEIWETMNENEILSDYQPAEEQATVAYTDENIQTLTGIQHIRLRQACISGDWATALCPKTASMSC